MEKKEEYLGVKSLGKPEELEDLELDLRAGGFSGFRETAKSRLRLNRDPNSSRQVI